MTDKIIIKSKEVDLDLIRTEITSLTQQANTITFIPVGKYPKEVIDLIEKENTERSFIKADLLNNVQLKQDLITYYKSKEIVLSNVVIK